MGHLSAWPVDEFGKSSRRSREPLGEQSSQIRWSRKSLRAVGNRILASSNAASSSGLRPQLVSSELSEPVFELFEKGRVAELADARDLKSRER